MTRSHRIATAVVLAAIGALTTDCGNAIDAEVVGMAAVSVDRAGSPIIVVAVCSDHIDRVEVFGTREGLDENEPNPQVGSWTATDPQTGHVSIDVAAPGGDWTASGPIKLETGDGYIVNASRSDADVETTQVNFTGRDLATLDPSQIIVRDAEVWTREKFDAEACS